MSKDLRPFIIPVFIPHMGCPHRCVFCNQRAITGAHFHLDAVSNIISTGLSSPKRTHRPVQVAFYGGNFCSLPPALQQGLLEQARPFLERGEVHSVRVSTRPDSLSPRILTLLRQGGVSTVELGVQSLDEAVLRLSQRGHSAAAVAQAVRLCRQQDLQVGLQLMVGLPGDSPIKALHTARRAVTLGPDMVRIYPTLVLEGSKLAHWYRQGRYRPLSLTQAVSICRDMVMIFEQAGIPVIRIGLQDTPSLNREGGVLAGPHHPALGQMVKSAVWLKKIRDSLQTVARPTQNLTIRVCPADFSNARGHKNANLEELRRLAGLQRLEVVADPALAKGELRLET